MPVQSDPSLDKFKNQNYDEIKAICEEDLGEGEYWTDIHFPPTLRSLFRDAESTLDIVWKRPWEIRRDARVCIDGYTLEDVHQGQLGNCWFVASIASLAQHPTYFKKVIPEGQTFFLKDGYCGCFLFKFWQFGKWIEVVIDDYLPTIDGRLIYMYSNPANEFWTCLVEKAYAKLNGCYEALDGGYSRDALVNLTGGVCIYHNFLSEDIESKEALQKSVRKDIVKSFTKAEAIVCCSTANVDNLAQETKLEHGLVTGHVYTVGFCHETTDGKVLLKCRNPWGQIEWNGKWSDTSELWDSISEEDRAIMKPEIKEDGEFWINFDEFILYFEDVTICRVGYYAFEAAADARKRWFLADIAGEWIVGKTAGGCSNYLKRSADDKNDRSLVSSTSCTSCVSIFKRKETFWKNPQFMFDITESAEDDVQIILYQPSRRKDDKDSLIMGFMIFQVSDDEKDDKKIVWENVERQAPKSQYQDMLQVCLSCELAVGRYVVIPSTYYKNKASEFLLRVFSESDVKLRALE